MLFLPFKRTVGVAVSDAIRQYILTKYNQHPDMFTEDLKTIDHLRAAAVFVQEAHVSGVKKLQSYAAQLAWMSGKFPIDIGVDFPWCPALGYQTDQLESQDNLKFELASVLFNLAAIYSQLGHSSNRNDLDVLKTALKYFCLSAGVLSYIKTDVLPEMRSSPPEDMDPMTLESLQLLMLAQGQECIWVTAIKKSMSDAAIAKLAVTVSDLYNDAGDFGQKSSVISSEWIHHMTAKHHHFAAAAQYRASCDCLEKRKYGEEVARLRDSVNCINAGLKESKYINRLLLADMNGLKNKLQEDLKRAENDNDMIYLMMVPPKSELKTLLRTSAPAPRIPDEISNATILLSENGGLGKPLFTKLVPYAVHVAASIYVDKRDRLVNQTIEDIENLTTKLHVLLRSLNLPGSLQALEKPLGLPPGLVSRAEEIRQQDGLTRLRRAMIDTYKLRDSARAIYQEGVNLLQSEASEDDAARRKFGTERWARPPPQQAVPKLYGQIDEVEGYLKTAAGSDETIQTKLRENEKLIELMAGPDSNLEHFVPSARSAVMSPAVEKEATKLRACLNEASRLESRRKRHIEALRSKAKQDDINPDLLRETARLEREYPMIPIAVEQFEDLFEERLTHYSSIEALVQEEEQAQNAITTKLQQSNASFVSIRRKEASSSTNERERALQSLENAFFKYKEVVSNLDAARKFYNDLAKIVGRFRDDCKQFAYSRRSDAAVLEQEIRTMAHHLSNLSIGGGGTQGPSAQLQREREASDNRPPYSAPAPVLQSIPAPQPNRPAAGALWTKGMEIKFAEPTAPGQQKSGGAPGGAWDASKQFG